MRSLVTYISVFALLAHFMLGCCAHHESCCAEADGVAPTETSVTCHDTEPACHDHDDAECPAPSHEHAPQGGCHDLPCAAVRVLKAHAPDVSSTAMVIAALSLPAYACDLTAHESLEIRGSPGEPPRLNLLHQVFLI